jgi:formylglycine-generating enzyme required for sulfatase activity/predicted Ser/Thr protein kinase
MTRLPSDSNSADAPSENAAQYRSQGEHDTRLDSVTREASSKSNSLETFQQVLPARYQLIREIGQGGMGQVILAIDRGATLKDHEYVAIKRMLGPTLSSSSAVDRFLAEVKLARALRHPNVVKMYHSDNTVLGPYIVMEYIDGEDLGKYIDRHGPLSEQQAVLWFCKLADALDEGHSKRLIHRDLKPKNILISTSGEPYLVDFGIAHRLSEMDRTGTGFGAGTIEYMSPEQLENRTPDVNQDVYSFGATIYHAVEGVPPFQADTVPRLISKVMSEPAPRSRRVSSALANRIACCLEKDPKKRPSSCKAILEGLSKSETVVPSPIPPSPLPPVSPTDTRTPERASSEVRTPTAIAPQSKAVLLTLLLLLAGVVLLGIGRLVMMKPREPSTVVDPIADSDNFGMKSSNSPSPKAKPYEESPASKSPARPDPSKTTPSMDDPSSKIPLPEQFTNSIGMEFQLIKPGTFMMGSPTSDPIRFEDETQHQVTLTRSYYLGVNEVTQEQYQRVMGMNPSGFKGASNPVDSVSWEDAVAFISKLNDLETEKSSGRVYRLPTEAEWEYACRAGTKMAYSFGESMAYSFEESKKELDKYAWYYQNSEKTTHPVGKKLPNGWGLYDMHGNVWEWCSDRYADYPSGAVTDPIGSSEGLYRVSRGGGWDDDASCCRSADRSGGSPSLRLSINGFRVALSEDTSREISTTAEPLSMNEGRGGDLVTSNSSKTSPLAKDNAPIKQTALPEQFTNSMGMEFKLIKPGTFIMGSPTSEPHRNEDETQHQVTLTRPYYLGVYEVTQEQYQRVMGINPSYFKGASNPVDSVSSEDAKAFLSKLNDLEIEKSSGRVYRLPTEAEWEYACRAGSATAYSFGDSEKELENYAWYSKNSGVTTHPVGEKLPNAWGLYDMHGNVREWCSDRCADYPSGSVTDPFGSNGGFGRVDRGGSWNDEAAFCRSALRLSGSLSDRDVSYGFRVALSPSGIPK